MSEPIPAKLGKYVIRRELGRGAMGVVYEGFDPFIERTVAIKTIKPQQLVQADAAEVLLRFKREAQAAGRLNHPNIVAIYEYGEEDGIAFIAMEFVKGKELKAFFDSGQRFANKEIARIMGEVLSALDHAHRNGVTHRDIKPANLIVLDNGVVKVADFGIARIETSELTQAGTMLGTPSYMSPEQFLGTTVDGRSDIFSCGVILYQFLTGERPFSGAVTTIMHKVLKEDPLPPSALNATLPPAWDGVVKRAIAKNPADRYQTAAQFAADITAVAEGRAHSTVASDATLMGAVPPHATMAGAPPSSAGVQARTSSTAAVPATPATTPAVAPVISRVQVAPQAAVTETPRKKQNMAVWAGVAVALMVAVAGGSFFLGGGKNDVKPTINVTADVTAAKTAPAASVAASTASSTPSVPSAPAGDIGLLTISAVGFADPARFNGDAAAAGAEARADAKRQLIEKALALYVSNDSINRNYQWVQDRFLPRSAEFIKTTVAEEAPQIGKDGLMIMTMRATIKVRDVQKSLNQMGEKERIEFIRNNGDPKIAVQMQISQAESAQALPAARSQLAENAIKERIKSFGFRTWSVDGETRTGPDAKVADFHIIGEVRVKPLSMRLAASGLTVTKTAMTSWTVKAIDRATGEEIYNNTKLPKNTSWASEDAALADIGKLVGDEFSKSFFLAHFSFGSQKVSLNITGLDAGASRAMMRELKSLRGVLDAQTAGGTAFQVELPEGNATDLITEGVLHPLNAKLGQACFTLGAVSGTTVNVVYSPACAQDAVRAKFDTAPPAGLLSAPPPRGKSILKV